MESRQNEWQLDSKLAILYSNFFAALLLKKANDANYKEFLDNPKSNPDLLRAYLIRDDKYLTQDPFLRAAGNIVAFLKDEQAVKKHIIKLEERLAKKLQEANLKPGEKGSMHILRQLLEQDLAPHGFKLKFAQVVGELTLEELCDIISQRLLFKDTALRQTKHGEWSHVLQVWVIAMQNEDTPFLSGSTVADLFEKFATKIDADKCLWDYVLDNDARADYTPNLGVAENWTGFIDKFKNELPCLSTLLHTRAQKARPKAFTENKSKKYTQQTPNLWVPKSNAKKLEVTDTEISKNKKPKII